jgi:hypothetical protein
LGIEVFGEIKKRRFGKMCQKTSKTATRIERMQRIENEFNPCLPTGRRSIRVAVLQNKSRFEQFLLKTQIIRD